MNTKELLEARGKTHGDFRENARVSQNIKLIMRSASGWTQLSDSQAEALELIALKISRILSGMADHGEHWDDLGGYAGLGKKDCSQ
jgi:hypothetical protein